MDIDELSHRYRQSVSEVSRVLVGQEEVVEHVLLALLVRGHVLLEGVPGLGKTLLARALSYVIGTAFRRIQFTPDLMPADITGGNVLDAKTGQFVFTPGPVFTQLLLADEINRAPAKTQSALLEAMQESSVTTDGVTRALADPFFVIATQNPIESQGTYPLPEAQLDRFLLKINIGHPSRDSEKRVLQNYLDGFDAIALERAGLAQRLTVEDLTEMKRVLAGIRVDPTLLDYVTEIVGRTRTHPSVYVGASPRASVGLLLIARAHAASRGRDFVVPDDVKAFAPAVLRHRLLLHPDAELENITTDDCIESVLREVSVPKGAA